MEPGKSLLNVHYRCTNKGNSFWNPHFLLEPLFAFIFRPFGFMLFVLGPISWNHRVGSDLKGLLVQPLLITAV